MLALGSKISFRLISCRALITVALLWAAARAQAANQVIEWGSTNLVLADFSGVTAIAGGPYFNLGVATDGSIIARRGGDNAVLTMPAEATNLVQVASCPLYYENHGLSLALRTDGTVVSLDYRNYSLSRSYGFNTPVPPGLSNVIAVATGMTHALALKKDGTVTAWGTQYYGETSVPPGLTNVIAIAAGDNYSLALKADGRVLEWGGFDNPVTNVPSSLTNIIAIAAGYDHAVALRDNGTVAAWGNSLPGQTNVLRTLSNVVAIAAGFGYDLALKSDGTVVGWGYDGYHNLDVPAGLTNVSAISAGGHSLALVGEGAPVVNSILPDLLVKYGDVARLRAQAVGAAPLHYQWQLNGIDVPGATNSVLELIGIQVSQGGIYSITVSNAFGTVSKPQMHLSVIPLFLKTEPTNQAIYPGGTAVFSVDARGEPPISYQWRVDNVELPGATSSMLTLTNVAYSQSGTYSVEVSNPFTNLSSQATLSVVPIAAWGDNRKGETTVPLSLTNVIALSAGDGFSVALRDNGRVVGWGDNSFGQTNVPAAITNTIAIACGASHVLALQGDGHVAGWGDNTYGQATPPNDLANVVAIAAGVNHSLALKRDGIVIAWGAGGLNANPVDVNNYGQSIVPAGLSNVVALGGGRYHSLALTSDGMLAAWGKTNDYGQASVPSGLSAAGAIACGYRHSLELGMDGILFAWGDSSRHQTNVPVQANGAIAIAANGYHNVGLLPDGSLVCWGDNTYRQCDTPTTLRNATAIACGRYHSLALISQTGPRDQVKVLPGEKTSDSFKLILPTDSGRVYRLEYVLSLTDPVWLALPLVPGNGDVQELTDHSASDSSRFYRVRRW